jgi:hypothetical protein
LSVSIFNSYLTKFVFDNNEDILIAFDADKHSFEY